MRTRFLATVALAASLATVAVAQPMDATTAFAGHWRVKGVAVSDNGVQALSDNDPSLMGRGLTFSRARLAWDRPSTTHDNCLNPRFTRLRTPAPAALRSQLHKLGLPRPTPFLIRCQSGSWGPGDSAMIFRGAGGALAMPWYDGGLLKLAR